MHLNWHRKTCLMKKETKNLVTLLLSMKNREKNTEGIRSLKWTTD